MIRATLQNGAIVLLDPIPPEWKEGTELDVTPAYWSIAGEESSGDLEPDAEHDEASRENDFVLRGILDEQRRLSKEQVRREMGLSP